MPTLTLPTPGVTPGPLWASQLVTAIQDVNAAVDLAGAVTVDDAAPSGGFWIDTGSGAPNISPTVTITSFTASLLISTLAFTGSDPDGNTPLTYSVNWGDGATTAGATSPLNHTYAATGTYTATVTVTDSLGATGTDSENISVSSSGGFLPSTLSGLHTWIDADDASTFSYSSGSVVSQWRDKSGNSRHFAQATVGNQPSRTGAQNGRTTVRFDLGDGNKWMDTASFTALTQPFTYFLALDVTNAAQQGWFSSVGGNLQTFVGDTEVFLYAGGAVAETSVEPQGAHVWTFMLNGASSTARRDATDLTLSANPGTSSVTTGFRLAERDLNPGYRISGELFEVIVYNRALTGTEQTQVKDYLKTKWGTP